MKEITALTLEKMEQEFDANAAHKLAMNAATKSGITTLLRDADLEKRERFSFSIDLEAGKVTNQKQSGRCWMFAALNTMRVEVMKKLNLENMELSQNYTLFYDKLEKANYFLESILDTVDEPTDGRLISWLLMAPLNDGGQWDMLANIIRKYGIVPKEAMPETFSSSCTREITPWMTKKLREFACTLRTAYAKGASMEELQEKKQEMMSVIYRMLVIALGKPPKTFTWETRDKDKQFIRIADITPQQFFAEYVGWNLDDYVSIINAPTQDKPFHHSYTVQYLGNVTEGHIVRHLNLPIEEMKKLAITQMQDGQVVWFGCDVGQFHEKDLGIMDTDGIQAGLLFDTDFPMTKAQRLDYGESLMTHAMVFTGVNLDKVGKPNRWKVENSWGEDRGNKGFYIMSDRWFDEYMYQIVVNKKYLSKEQLKAYEEEPTVLAPWDPMGSLAL
ncbi:MAG: C1 family peptidase [Lachnospiraceae bacterium]|nr:C1 family peptidase [Lachnospiraceae bacterium]